MHSPDSDPRDVVVREATARLQAAVQCREETALPHLESTANPAFVVDLETLRLVASLVAELGPGHVLALGCSPITELLALLGFAQGRMVVTCYEHDPWLAEELLNAASPYAINYRWFAFCLCPLVARRCGEDLHPVYDDRMTVPLAPLPADLVIIEGPPAALGGRGGSIYQAAHVARPGAIVLLLDVRSEEASMIEAWQHDLQASVRVLPPGLMGRHLAFVVHAPLAEPVAMEHPRAQALATLSGA